MAPGGSPRHAIAQPLHYARLSSVVSLNLYAVAMLATTSILSLTAPRTALAALTSSLLASIQKLATACRKLTAMRFLFFWAIDAFEKSGPTT